jgi:hypothetical protein
MLTSIPAQSSWEWATCNRTAWYWKKQHFIGNASPATYYKGQYSVNFVVFYITQRYLVSEVIEITEIPSNSRPYVYAYVIPFLIYPYGLFHAKNRILNLVAQYQ